MSAPTPTPPTRPPTPSSHAADPPDVAELEARAQDRAERRLFLRQAAIVVLIAAVVALRLLLI